MFKKLFVVLVVLVLSGCIAKKKTTYSKSRTVTVDASKNKKEKNNRATRKITGNPTADKVVESAMQFTGVKYKFGGTNRKGMDCSGLVYVALQKNAIVFPRVSHQMANEGKRIRLADVQKGDLLFFKTRKKGKNINHVGLIVAIEGDEIKFIHSTTSRGVIVSSLREGYWSAAFVKATRIL